MDFGVDVCSHLIGLNAQNTANNLETVFEGWYHSPRRSTTSSYSRLSGFLFTVRLFLGFERFKVSFCLLADFDGMRQGRVCTLINSIYT